MTKQQEDTPLEFESSDLTQTFKQLLIKCNTNAYRIAKETGIDKAYLSKLSSGAIAKPGEDKLIKIAEALDIEPQQLSTVFTEPKVAVQEFGLMGIDLQQPIINLRQDWGAAPDGIICYARQKEIDLIKGWINIEHSRIINLFGLGGIGKTTLAIEIAKQLESQFDYVFWRSLGNHALVEVIIQDSLKLFEPRRKNSQANISQQIARLLSHLRTHRCLFVLDQVETILTAGNSIQSYQNGCEVFGELFRQLAELNHQSCLIVLGNEKPRDIAVWESSSALIHSLQIKGDKEVGYKILKDKKLLESAAWDELIEVYRGHPLALKIVATMINELFNGNVENFLRQNTLFLGDLEFILYQQYERLSSLEREIMQTIAKVTNPLSLSELAKLFSPQLRCSEIINYLNILSRRSLLEIIDIDNISFYSLQPIVRKYINSRI